MANAWSTDRHRESRGQNVSSCIFVSVVFCLAAWASPFAHVEGEILNDVATGGTRLAARVEAINLNQISAIPGALVFEKVDERAPSSIRDRSGEAVIANHPGDVQVLYDDHLVFANESSREFMQLVAATVSHLSMETSELNPSLVLVLGSFLLAGEYTREAFFAFCFPGVMFEVRDLLSCGERNQIVDAEIYTNGSLESRETFGGVILAEQGHMPTLRGVQGHRCARWFGSYRKRSTPTDVERSIHFRQGKLSIGEPKPATGKFGRATCSLFFEAWIFCAFGKEVSISCLQVAQSLLDRNARNIIQKSKLRLFLPAGEGRTLSGVSDGFLAAGPCFRAFVQSAVVDEATTSNRPTKQVLLLSGRIEAVLEPSQRHACRIHCARVKSTIVAIGRISSYYLRQAIPAIGRNLT